jgi:hypothetical protein
VHGRARGDEAQRGDPHLLSAARRRGEAEKLAFVACMQKLLTILNVMIRTAEPWSTNAALTPA